MSEKKEKGLLNEILPDPTHARADLARGTPRQRTSDHLRRLLAAAAGIALQFPGVGHADSSVPPVGDKSKNDPQGKQPDAPQIPSYRVVDPIPQPHIDREGAPGFLNLHCTPTAEISVDGVATGKKTPQNRMPLTPGVHVIALSAGPSLKLTFSVEVASGKTIKETHTLRTAKPAKKK